MSAKLQAEFDAAVLSLRGSKGMRLTTKPSVIRNVIKEELVEKVGVVRLGGKGRPANLYALTASGRKRAGVLARKTA